MFSTIPNYVGYALFALEYDYRYHNVCAKLKQKAGGLEAPPMDASLLTDFMYVKTLLDYMDKGDKETPPEYDTSRIFDGKRHKKKAWKSMFTKSQLKFAISTFFLSCTFVLGPMYLVGDCVEVAKSARPTVRVTHYPMKKYPASIQDALYAGVLEKRRAPGAAAARLPIFRRRSAAAGRGDAATTPRRRSPGALGSVSEKHGAGAVAPRWPRSWRGGTGGALAVTSVSERDRSGGTLAVASVLERRDRSGGALASVSERDRTPQATSSRGSTRTRSATACTAPGSRRSRSATRTSTSSSSGGRTTPRPSRPSTSAGPGGRAELVGPDFALKRTSPPKLSMTVLVSNPSAPSEDPRPRRHHDIADSPRGSRGVAATYRGLSARRRRRDPGPSLIFSV